MRLTPFYVRVDTIFTMKQRCSSRVVKCTYEIRMGDAIAMRRKPRVGARRRALQEIGESHAAAQEGELYKKSDDARVGGAECTDSMIPRNYNRVRWPTSVLERRLATVRLERSTPCPCTPGAYHSFERPATCLNTCSLVL